MYVLVLSVGEWDAVVRSSRDQPFTTVLAGILASTLIVLQFIAGAKAFRGNTVLAKKLAERNLLLLAAIYLLWVTVLYESQWFHPFGVGWTSAWFAGHPPGVNLVPYLILAQWIFAAHSERASAERLWRGAAAGAITLCALLGLIVVRMVYDGAGAEHSFGPKEWGTFWFFTIGVAVHALAFWRILVCRSYAWPWAVLVGFGSLSSGLYLIYGAKNLSEPWREIGGVLDEGWNEFAPGIPVCVYVLASMAGLALFVLRGRTDGTTLRASEKAR